MAKANKAAKANKVEVETATVLSIGESNPHDLIIEGAEGEFFDGDTDRHTPERVEATARSMHRYGQLQRIRVVDAGPRGLIVVMGKGRTLAARWLRDNLDPSFTLKWECIDLANGDTQFAMLTENTIRTAPTPMNAARVLKAALDKGTPRAEVEVVAGGARSLDAYLDILARATPDVQSALEAGRITKSAAKRLAEQTPEVQTAALDTILDTAARAEASDEGEVRDPTISAKAVAKVDPQTGVGAVSNSGVEAAIAGAKGAPLPPKDAPKGKTGKGKGETPAAPVAPAAPAAPARDPKTVASDCLRRARLTVGGAGESEKRKSARVFAAALLDYVVNGAPLPKSLRAEYGTLFASLTGEGESAAQTDAA